MQLKAVLFDLGLSLFTDPDRKVSCHRLIEGWRGKADPGWCFSWDRFYAECYPGRERPTREPFCPAEFRTALAKFSHVVPADREEAVLFWHALSAVTEAGVALACQSASSGA